MRDDYYATRPADADHPAGLALARRLADQQRCSLIDPLTLPPQRALVAKWGAHTCLRDQVLPWRRIGGAVIVLVTAPEIFARHHAALHHRFGDVRMALTTEAQLISYVTRHFAAHLAARAETRVPDAESSRDWSTGWTLILGGSIGVGLITLLALYPQTGFLILGIWAVLTLLANTLLKAAAAAVGVFSAPRLSTLPAKPPRDLPSMTILIPLYKEKAIAAHLLERVVQLQYPRNRLDVCFVIEADDMVTRKTFGRANLPGWVRPIFVPKGTLKTKPRALNYALDLTKGDIVGVYDAEDAPDPGQLLSVARYFAHLPKQVACLQGALDYYNAPANWLTRCFTLEYAAWFRVVLPGLERMRLVVPLGGTTLFFRREILEKLGAWDAHNVTEDADLGVRLARHGYRTTLIATTTEEEANGQVWPWIKQRSRWLKGYMITYAVHMRSPRQLLRDLGIRRFCGFQILFAGTISQFLLAPILWSFWLLPLGLPHPMAAHLNGGFFWVLVGCFIASECVNVFAHALGVTKADKRWLIKWIPTLHLYFPLAALAAYKGLYELARRPFYWDKTAHGILLPAPTASPLRQASDG